MLQGSILAIAGLIVRLIGLAYRIPLTNTLTDEGAGLYGSAFTVYMMFLMISSYGLPAAISKLVAGKLALGKAREAHQIFKASLWFGLLSGTLFAGVLWFFAGNFADLIKSPDSKEAIMALAPAVFIFSLLAVFRGYYQGMNSMVPTAISQIFEQILNAVFSLLLGSIFIQKSVNMGAAGGTMGTGIGALAALVFMVFIYSISRNRVIYRRIKKDTHAFKSDAMLGYWSVLLKTAFPIILGTAILQLSGLIDLMMVQRGLQKNGLTVKASTELYGVYSMKVKVLIRLPIAIASALAAASVPSITKSLTLGHMKDVNHKILSGLKTTMLIVLPAAVGEIVLAKPILSLLFEPQNLEIGAEALRYGAIAIVLFGISTFTVGVLQGLDQLKVQALICTIGMIFKVLFNWLFLYVFNFQLNGVVMSDNLFALILVVLNLYVIYKETGIRLSGNHLIVKPLISALLMGGIVFFLYQLMFSLTKLNGLSTLVSIVVGIISYGIMIIKTGAMSEAELVEFPKGAVMVRWLKRIRIMD